MIRHVLELDSGAQIIAWKNATSDGVVVSSPDSTIPNKTLPVMEVTQLVEILTSLADMPVQKLMHLADLAAERGMTNSVNLIKITGGRPDVAGEFAMVLLHCLSDAAAELPVDHPVSAWMETWP